MDTVVVAVGLLSTGITATIGFASIVWKLGRLRASLEVDLHKINARIDQLEHHMNSEIRYMTASLEALKRP